MNSEEMMLGCLVKYDPTSQQQFSFIVRIVCAFPRVQTVLREIADEAQLWLQQVSKGYEVFLSFFWVAEGWGDVFFLSFYVFFAS